MSAENRQCSCAQNVDYPAATITLVAQRRVFQETIPAPTRVQELRKEDELPLSRDWRLAIQLCVISPAGSVISLVEVGFTEKSAGGKGVKLGVWLFGDLRRRRPGKNNQSSNAAKRKRKSSHPIRLAKNLKRERNKVVVHLR